jgi:hypothetical protein
MSHNAETFVLLASFLQTSRTDAYRQQLRNMEDGNGDAAHPRRSLVDCISTPFTPYS